ncbi:MULTISPECIES: hypothetical protein [unclassified Streptomyces]|uniref:hypothetical protein n=1 Tax=unclassified Streptomyces TaxID=2593676 RepID=UPI000DB9E641|nr:MULTISPECIES: hypothetical protein [unclassified Streptomyces]MYT73362.1 hypothetical protein [Streptomyces sp. SID8367]RAJ70580.1 hypothetical protein K377_07919 [Streptomyces sp. PsTaAH-137]
MSLSKPVKYGLLAIGLYVAGVLYLRFGAADPLGWDKALLVSLLATPVVLLWWWARDRLMDRARRAGERHRIARQ